MATRIFSPETYGARGNGSADDTNAFKQMHTAIINAQESDPNLNVVIELSSGSTYNYTWNRWTWGIENLTLEGNGAAIRNVGNSGSHAHDAVLRTNRDAFGTMDYDQVSNGVDFGYDIDSVSAGSTSVTLKNAAAAANFEVGKWALVASYSQQNGGYPPNPRYFDWVKVTEINGNTITFAGDPLEYEHRDDWPDRGESYEISGARIVAAERDIPYGENWLVKDLTALPNPNVGSWGKLVQIEGIIHAEFDNVDFPYWTGGQSKEIIFRNSNIPQSEPDKVLDLLRIENSTVGVNQVTGVNRVEIIDSYLDGRNNIQAREIYVDGSTFDGAKSTWGPLYIDSFVPIYKIEVVNSTFNGVGRNDWPIITDAQDITATIGQGGLSLSGGDLVLSGSSENLWGSYVNPLGLINRVYEGQFIELLNSNGGSKGYGQISTIRANGGPNTARIDVDWSVTPQAGDQVKVYGVAEVIGNNNTLNNAAFNTDYNGIAEVMWNGVEVQDKPWVTDSTPTTGKPNAVDDSGILVPEDGSVTIQEATLLQNDTDPEGNALDIVNVGNAINGQVSLNANGSVTFAPNKDFDGSARFSYTVQDTDGNRDTGLVSLSVTPTPDAPVAKDDSGLSTAADTPLTITAARLLSNDTDADGDALTLASVGNATNGSVQINSSGNVVFTPDSGYFGSASFTYRASDGTSNSNAANVTIAVDDFTSSQTYSLWNQATTPVRTNIDDGRSLELGVKFNADTDGYISGLRFYKSDLDTGTHTGNLWTSTGVNLGSVVFTNETARGWQEAEFATPIQINANETYVASYHSPTGYFSADWAFFTRDYASGPLTAPESSKVGGNGLFDYGDSSVFPESTWNSANYWVDVLFDEVSPISTSPTNGDDTLIGTDGDDVIVAQGGNDRVEGLAGDDVLSGKGGNDMLLGGGGNDRLQGGGDSDVLIGGGGKDVLNGHGGDDTMNGGSGADVFRFANTFGVDTVTDFDRAADFVHLKATNIDTFADLDSNGNGVLGNADDRITVVNGDTIINLGTFGEIQILGTTGLTESDFLI